MKKIAIATSHAPAAIGPYSQAVRVADFVFLSGQIPLNPATMQVESNEVESQTRQVMKNLEAVLASQGLEWSDVVKTTVFLKNMNDFPNFNRVYESFLQPPFPARATIEVARLPKDVLVEIEAIAHAR